MGKFWQKVFMKKEFLECGKIINTHGVIGEVKIDPWCDSPAVLAGLKRVYFAKNGSFEARAVLRASVFKRFVIAKIEGIDDMDKAEASKETVIFAKREDLKVGDGDYFIADLIGLPVIDINTGKTLGTLKDVFNSGASDIYEIETENGERLMPAVAEFVKKIDTEKGIFVSPIEEMFD